MNKIAPHAAPAVAQDVDNRCPHCQAANRPGARFCTRCGRSLHARRIPLAAASGERKLVTVMFADISGFTARSEHLDPEEVVTMMNACFVELDQAVSRYEGTIDKFIGDAMMVLFGAPAAHENDAERAVRCALEMQARLAAFSETHSSDLARRQPLALHIGINTGLVVAGEIGTPRRRDYTVMGDAVNLASRLESAATAGQILIGAGTHRQVERLFQCRPLPPLTLKGKSEPQQAYEVVGVTEAASARGFERAGVRAPLLGRDRELDLLSNAVQALEAGQGGLGCIVAEAGLGKSRLTAELRDRVGNRVTWVEARSLAYGAAIPYHALQNAFRQLLDVPASSAPGEAVARIRKGLAAFGDGADATAPVLWPHVVALLGYPLPADPAATRVTTMDSAARNGEFSWLLREHWRRVARVRPTVIVFEDLHWADPATVGLVRDLLPVTRDAALLFLLLYRPENEGPLARLRPLAEGDPRARVLRLQPLSLEQSTQMVRALLDRYHLPPELHARLLEKAEGNPFYLEEVSRSLLDHGVVSTEGGLWVHLQVEELDIPDSLHSLIATRVDRLSPALKSTLQRAAVIGRQFSAAGLTALVDEPPILPSHLAELEGRELIKPGPATTGTDGYAFKHALVQEVAYGSLLKEQRRLLHRVLADHLDTQHTEPGLLAYHYERAEEWPQALQWLSTAAEIAYAQYANSTALDLVGRALAAWAQVYPADAPADALRTKVALYELLAAVGVALADRAALPQAAGGLRDTGTTLDDARARVHGYLTATQLNHLESDWDTWEKNISAAHAIAAASGDQDLISDVYVRQARLYTNRLGPHAAIPYLRRSAAISYLIHDDRELTDSLNNLALAYQTTGEIRRAAWHAAYALKLSLRLGDLRLTAGNYLSVGRIALLRGQLASGLASMQAGQRDADRAGQARLQAITRDHVSMAYSTIGLYTQALEAAGEAGALIRRHGLDDLIGFNITTRADALIGMGRYDDARSTLDEMRRRRSTGQLGQWMGPLLIRRSLIDWLDGRPAQARATLVAARAHLPHLPSDLSAYTLWAAACLGMGDLADAQARIDQALAWLAQTANELDAPFTYAVAARVYAALGRPDLFTDYVTQARVAIYRQWTALANPRRQAAFAARWARHTAPLGLADALTPLADS